MKYLEEMDMLIFLQKKLKAEQRDQLTKNSIDDVKTVLSSVLISVREEATPLIAMTAEDLFQALKTIETMDISAIPDDIKNSIVEGILIIKIELAKMAFKYYEVETFEVTPETEVVMREVVLTYYGGGM